MFPDYAYLPCREHINGLEWINQFCLANIISLKFTLKRKKTKVESD